MRTLLAAAFVAAFLGLQGTSWSAEAAGEGLDARVTIRVKSAPLASFLDTLSEQAKVNFIITEGLEGKQVTAFLQNVTAREALQILLEIKGLTYRQIGKSNTYVVSPRSKTVEPLLTRIYSLADIQLASFTAEPPIIAALKSVLTKAGKVVGDPRTNAIVVTDYPDIFAQVEQVIAELDKPARK